MPAFYYIPKASLAAVVICAVTPMVDYRVVAKIWKIHSMFFGIRTQCTFTVWWPHSFFFLLCHPEELDLLPFIVTFLLSFWRVQYGIIGGVAISGALLMYTMARPGIKVFRCSSPFVPLNYMFWNSFPPQKGNNYSGIDWLVPLWRVFQWEPEVVNRMTFQTPFFSSCD